MANGRLGKVTTTANTWMLVYTAPTTVEFTTINVNIVNTAATLATVDVAITNAATPTVGDTIGWKDVLANDGGSVEYECYLMSPGEKLYVRSTNANTIVRAHGLEKIAV